MADLIGGNQGTLIQEAGTTVLESLPITLKRINLLGTYVGSVELYDSATTGGTAAGNLIYNIGLPLLNQYQTIDIDQSLKRGLTVVATGTPTAQILWNK